MISRCEDEINMYVHIFFKSIFLITGAYIYIYMCVCVCVCVCVYVVVQFYSWFNFYFPLILFYAQFLYRTNVYLNLLRYGVSLLECRFEGSVI